MFNSESNLLPGKQDKKWFKSCKDDRKKIGRPFRDLENIFDIFPSVETLGY